MRPAREVVATDSNKRARRVETLRRLLYASFAALSRNVPPSIDLLQEEEHAVPFIDDLPQDDPPPSVAHEVLEQLDAEESKWAEAPLDDLSERGQAVFEVWNQTEDTTVPFNWESYVEKNPSTYEQSMERLWKLMYRLRRKLVIQLSANEPDKHEEMLDILTNADWHVWCSLVAPVALRAIEINRFGMQQESGVLSAEDEILAKVVEPSQSTAFEDLAVFLRMAEVSSEPPPHELVPPLVDEIPYILNRSDEKLRLEKKPLLTDEFFHCDRNGTPQDDIFDEEAAQFCAEPFDSTTYLELCEQYQRNFQRVQNYQSTKYFSHLNNGLGFLVDKFLRGRDYQPLTPAAREDCVLAIKKRLLEYFGPGACQLRMSGLTLQKLSDWGVFTDYSAWQALEKSVELHLFDDDMDMIEAVKQLKNIHFPEKLKRQEDFVENCRRTAIEDCAALGIFPDFDPKAQQGYHLHLSKKHAKYINMVKSLTERHMREREIRIANYELVGLNITPDPACEN